MNYKLRLFAVALLILAVAVGVILGDILLWRMVSPPAIPIVQTTTAISMPNTVHGKLLVQDPHSDTGNQLLVNDKNGAPMFWVNMFGAQSGAEPVCAMDFKLRPVICLGGKYGQYGVTPQIVYYRSGKIWKIR